MLETHPIAYIVFFKELRVLSLSMFHIVMWLLGVIFVWVGDFITNYVATKCSLI